MTAVLDDHLLRDLLAGAVSSGLARLLGEHEPATTNLYLYRLARSAVSARGGALTGRWTLSQRRALAEQLVALPTTVVIVPMRELAFQMAGLAEAHRLSTLGAEAVAAAEHLRGPLCVWDGDDGPHIRAAAETAGIAYRTVSH